MLLGTWGGKDDVPPYIELLAANETKPLALAALGALKDKRGAEAVAKLLAVAGDREPAAKSLQAMGPAAEDVVIEYLRDKDDAVAISACKILGAIGTKKSLTAFRPLGTNANKELVQAANVAFKTISTRLR